MNNNKLLLNDETCSKCGHLGVYHLTERSDPYNAGCVAQVKTDSIYSRRCKCLIRIKEKDYDNEN